MNKNSAASSKQGIVMHRCPFTRCGLLYFLHLHLPEVSFQATDSFSKLERWSGLMDADLIVSDVRDENKSATDGINWLLCLQSIRGNKLMLVTTEHLFDRHIMSLRRQSSTSLLALQTPELELYQQIGLAVSGKQVISPMLLQVSTVANEHPAKMIFSESERQVLELLRAGYSVTQVATRLCRSVKTVSTHKRHLMRKLQANNEVELFSRLETSL